MVLNVLVLVWTNGVDISGSICLDKIWGKGEYDSNLGKDEVLVTVMPKRISLGPG